MKIISVIDIKKNVVSKVIWCFPVITPNLSILLDNEYGVDN